MAEILDAARVHNAPREAEWLLEAATSGSPTSPVVAIVPDLPPSGLGRVDDEIAAAALELARRRAAGEPLQYLTGVAGFRRLELAVGPGVLIPRPETEIVAEKAMEVLPLSGTLIDVGTGSGAIALAVADERPDATVVATELYAEALRWAIKNRDALGLRVELVQGDLFEGMAPELRGKVDVVVSNLPYIGERERQDLPLDVVDHEPGVAIFGGHDGLDVIKRMSRASPTWLRDGGWLVMEISPWQKADVTRLLEAAGYADVGVERDLTGRDRVAYGRFKR